MLITNAVRVIPHLLFSDVWNLNFGNLVNKHLYLVNALVYYYIIHQKISQWNM